MAPAARLKERVLKSKPTGSLGLGLLGRLGINFRAPKPTQQQEAYHLRKRISFETKKLKQNPNPDEEQVIRREISSLQVKLRRLSGTKAISKKPALKLVRTKAVARERSAFGKAA